MSMDVHTMQSMDWLFKKEKIYMLVQFWQQRATLAEQEVCSLKKQLAKSKQSGPEIKMAASLGSQPSSGASPDDVRSSLEVEISSKDKEISQLLEDVQRLQTNIGKLQENSANQIARLEEELENKRQHILRLEAKLEAQKDYNDLKRKFSTTMKLSEDSIKSLPENNIDKANSICKQEKSPPPSSSSTPPAPSDIPTLHNVETFGSFLGEEIVANWRRSLERTMVSQAARPTPPPNLSYAWSTLDESKVKLEESREREEIRSSSPSVHETTLLNGNTSPMNIDTETNNNNNNINNNNNTSNGSHSNNNSNNNNNSLSNGICGFNVGLNNNVLHSGGPLSLNDVIKSPFRFDDRSPFRYADDPGCMVGRFGESLIPKGDPMEARLQEMLRYNMDKYANQNLDTLHIARRVRELLSIHNVGQRLFAKYVLGLSQGTVSELLSKPKPWDKLTEKGRDSYRKMHAWASDENAVLLLKSLIPKKGKEPSVGTVIGRPENDITEERIAHILSEASHLMKPHAQDDSPSNDESKSPNNLQGAESPGGRDSHSRRLKKYENDDITQEQVTRIYQEELEKLMGRRFSDQPFQSLMFPHFLASGNTEDIRLAMDAYHRELIKLNPNNSNALPFPLAAMHQQIIGSHNGVAQDLSLPKIEKKEKVSNEDEKKEEERHGGSAFSLVRPKVEPTSPLGNVILPPEDLGPTTGSSTASVSPLQRMASITNSLISQPPAQHHHTTTQRPLKAVLPPITQQQFDQFNNLNTEEIVRKVKEQLSQFSISQRLFGESVLGLSQGSVSDLLARPKPWHMLTQKGREPFIRMKMFLEDDNAVHKLVASQYKIAPEKLMRTGGYGVSPSSVIPNHPKPVVTNCVKYGSGDYNIHNSNPIHIPHTTPTPSVIPPPLTPPEIKKCPMTPQQCQPSLQQFSVVKSIQNMPTAPSVYEMAALTQELDTQTITTKIKEALLANNIGQKIFGEAVLGLSQGSVSELLSKPKPWHMLSIKGREPFIRMQLWLCDSQNIDRLQAIKTERRELNKRRRGSGQQDNSSDTSSNDTSEFYHSSANSPPSAKKQRVLFSEEQKEALKIAFALDPYPSLATIEFLANELNLVSRTITNWFHNHRMRIKQSAHSESLNREGQGGGFDPVQFRILLSQRLGIHTPFSSATQYFSQTSVDALSSRDSLGLDQREEGLDLSLKHDEEFEDNESHVDSEDSYTGGLTESNRTQESRSSRRKPAAPQWVNPDWQQESEVIINGVCVMQTDDYDREGREETIRVEPTPVPEDRTTSPDQPINSSDESKKISLNDEKDDKWDNQF